VAAGLASANNLVWPREAATFTVQWQAQVTFDSRPLSMLWNAPLWPEVA